MNEDMLINEIKQIKNKQLLNEIYAFAKYTQYLEQSKNNLQTSINEAYDISDGKISSPSFENTDDLFNDLEN
jgi:hypothetical protein